MPRERLDDVASLRAALDDLRAGRCLGVIPGTVIACSEAGAYCSEACFLRAQNQLLRQTLAELAALPEEG